MDGAQTCLTSKAVASGISQERVYNLLSLFGKLNLTQQ